MRILVFFLSLLFITTSYAQKKATKLEHQNTIASFPNHVDKIPEGKYSDSSVIVLALNSPSKDTLFLVDCSLGIAIAQSWRYKVRKVVPIPVIVFKSPQEMVVMGSKVRYKRGIEN